MRGGYEIDGVMMDMNMNLNVECGWEDVLGVWPGDVCAAFA